MLKTKNGRGRHKHKRNLKSRQMLRIPLASKFCYNSLADPITESNSKKTKGRQEETSLSGKELPQQRIGQGAH